MQYDLCVVWDEQRGESRQVIFGPEDGEGERTATLASIEAESWLHAKRALGFELTALQERLVDLPPAGRAALIFGERWAGMGEMLVKQTSVTYPRGWIENPLVEGRELNAAQRLWNARRGL